MSLVNLIKKIFKLKNNKCENKSVYDTLKVGDIIWAKRYTTEEEKNIIQEGHQNGPFIILKKIDKKVLCVSGTSNIPKEEYTNMYMKINNNYLYKITFFNLNNFFYIDSNTFIRKLGNLTDSELSGLFNKIKYKNKGSVVNALDLPLQIGDIISRKDINYIILDKVDDNILCIPIKKRYNKGSIYSFNNLNFESVIKINIDNVKYIDTVSNSVLMILLKKQSEYLKNLSVRNIPQRGSVISFSNKLYYIYGEEGSNWLVFEIFKDRKNFADEIKISNKKFYTTYKDNILNKNDIDCAISLAYDEEMENIKQKRKTYKKEHENTSVRINKKLNFSYKDVIIIDGEEYYILDFIGKDILKSANKQDFNKKGCNAVYIKTDEISSEQIIKSKIK